MFETLESKFDMGGGFRPIIEHGLICGFVVMLAAFVGAVGAMNLDSYDWPGHDWLLILPVAFAVGFVPGISWAIWKSYFPRSQKADNHGNDKKA